MLDILLLSTWETGRWIFIFIHNRKKQSQSPNAPPTTELNKDMHMCTGAIQGLYAYETILCQTAPLTNWLMIDRSFDPKLVSKSTDQPTCAYGTNMHLPFTWSRG